MKQVFKLHLYTKFYEKIFSITYQVFSSLLWHTSLYLFYYIIVGITAGFADYPNRGNETHLSQ